MKGEKATSRPTLTGVIKLTSHSAVCRTQSLDTHAVISSTLQLTRRGGVWTWHEKAYSWTQLLPRSTKANKPKPFCGWTVMGEGHTVSLGRMKWPLLIMWVCGLKLLVTVHSLEIKNHRWTRSNKRTVYLLFYCKYQQWKDAARQSKQQQHFRSSANVVALLLFVVAVLPVWNLPTPNTDRNNTR